MQKNFEKAHYVWSYDHFKKTLFLLIML